MTRDGQDRFEWTWPENWRGALMAAAVVALRKGNDGVHATA
jgi:hypothetical protein